MTRMSVLINYGVYIEITGNEFINKLKMKFLVLLLEFINHTSLDH